MRNTPYHITIRPWVPRRIPYEVSQEMLNEAFAKKKSELSPFIYLGWRSLNKNGKRNVVFCVGHGESRATARSAFKDQNPGQMNFVIDPQKEM